MTDVADLRIRVSSDDVPKATSRLAGMSAAGNRAERATDGLVGSIGRMAAGLAVGATAMMAFNKLLNTQRQFDVINAGLITATGSAEDAALAFEALRDFATTTPYDLQQVSESFVKLVNLGLTPSERALTSYGNTASAMGKDLNQMIEAVADASTGEFERLKEFGIRASKQGDQVQFTFRGVSETVAFESGQIEEYLTRLGETNFADAMSNRMATLDGAVSNLGDTWDQMFLNINESGVGDMIASGVNIAIDALNALNDWLMSGQLEGAIDSLGQSFGPWVDDAGAAIDIVQGLFDEFTGYLNTEYPGEMDVVSSVWEEFPENIRAVVQLAAIHVAWFVEEVKVGMDQVEQYLDAVRDGWGGDQLADVTARAVEASARNRQVLAESVDLVYEQRDATIAAATAAREAAVERAETARREREERRAALGDSDRLARFGVDRTGQDSGPSDEETKAAEQAQKAYDNLVEALQTEEEALAASYAARLQLIESHTTAESDLRADLMRRLNEWRDEESEGIEESKNKDLQQIIDSLRTEEEVLEDSYQRRRQIILDSMEDGEARDRLLEQVRRERDEGIAREVADQEARYQRLMEASASEIQLIEQQRDAEILLQQEGLDQMLINEEEFQRNKAAIEQRYHEVTQALLRDRQTQQLDAYGSMFGALGGMFSQFASGQGKSAERMFKISKALNMGQAIMSMASGIMKAQELGYPMNIVESIRIGALGATQIAAIQSQRFAGAYDEGGRIPAGKFGVVGEKGMEFVEGPANVTGREDTARLLREAAENKGGGDVNVSISNTVVVQDDGTARSETKSNADNTEARMLNELVTSRVKQLMVDEARPGGILWRMKNG